MTRIPRAVSLLAVLGWAAGLAVSPAAAQDTQPAPGLEPGQAYVLTIQGERGTPLMVVHVGRIPLASEPRVELLLPDLGDSGLNYAVSTVGRSLALCDPPLDPYPDSGMKKPQHVVGRVHTVVILSPLDPPGDDGIQECIFTGFQVPDGGVLGSGEDPVGAGGQLSDHSMTGSTPAGNSWNGGPPGHGPPPGDDDLYGGERRPRRPLRPADGLPDAGTATPPGLVDGVLVSGGQVTGVDPGGSGPQEAVQSCTFGGYPAPSPGAPMWKDGLLGLDPAVRLVVGIDHESLRAKEIND